MTKKLKISIICPQGVAVNTCCNERSGPRMSISSTHTSHPLPQSLACLYQYNEGLVSETEYHLGVGDVLGTCNSEEKDKSSSPPNTALLFTASPQIPPPFYQFWDQWYLGGTTVLYGIFTGHMTYLWCHRTSRLVSCELVLRPLSSQVSPGTGSGAVTCPPASTSPHLLRLLVYNCKSVLDRF